MMEEWESPWRFGASSGKMVAREEKRRSSGSSSCGEDAVIGFSSSLSFSWSSNAVLGRSVTREVRAGMMMVVT